MSPLFEKLGLNIEKLGLNAEAEILVLNAPETIEAELEALDGEGITVMDDVDDVEKITFLLAFVMQQAEIDSIAADLADKAQADAIVWFAFPKISSKRYKCQFSQDTGWASLSDAGFESIKQIPIDADWAALRFRRAKR
jgi:hypothetical protein